MISPTFFFRYFKGRCYGNQFSGKNGAKLPTPSALIALSIQNGMGYRDLNVRVISANDVSIPGADTEGDEGDASPTSI